MTNNQHFFAKYSFILKKNRFDNFKISTSIEKQVCKRTPCIHVFVIVNPMVWTINIFSTILANVNNFFGYTLFANYFVPNIS